MKICKNANNTSQPLYTEVIPNPYDYFERHAVEIKGLQPLKHPGYILQLLLLEVRVEFIQLFFDSFIENISKKVEKRKAFLEHSLNIKHRTTFLPGLNPRNRLEISFLSPEDLHEDRECLYLVPSWHDKEESCDEVHALAVADPRIVYANAFEHSEQRLLSNIRFQNIIVVWKIFFMWESSG